MIGSLFNTVIYEPLYNGLIFLIDILPGANAGFAVLLLTVLVKLLIFPLSKSAVETQMKVKEIDPEIKKIREEHKTDREAQARALMALYRDKKINPFSSIFLILIQIPIILGLYFVFLRGGLPDINTDILYAFVPTPEMVNMQFLGFIDIAGKSVLLALTAGISQFIQGKLMIPPMPPKKTSGKPSLKDDLARSMNVQMRYVLPVIVFFIAWQISAAIALYWTTSNVFTIGQEFAIRRKRGALAKGVS